MIWSTGMISLGEDRNFCWKTQMLSTTEKLHLNIGCVDRSLVHENSDSNLYCFALNLTPGYKHSSNSVDIMREKVTVLVWT